jgi:hypothetical protein
MPSTQKQQVGVTQLVVVTALHMLAVVARFLGDLIPVWCCVEEDAPWPG